MGGFFEGDDGTRSMSRLMLFLPVVLISVAYIWRVWAVAGQGGPPPAEWCMTVAATFDETMQCADRSLAVRQSNQAELRELLANWTSIVWAGVGAYLSGKLPAFADVLARKKGDE